MDFNEYIDCTILSVEKTAKYYEIKVGLKNKSKETVRLANLSEKKVLQLKDKEGYVSYSLHPILNITIPEESGKFETHENYSDIQYVIEGSEHMVYASRHELTPKTEYNAEKDITFYENDVKGIAMLTKKDFYCIFQPQDAHKPKVMVDSPAPIKKVIVKIKEQ